MKKRPTPKLGQHFLTGLWAAAKLAESVGVGEGEIILEIGPGKGALTRELLKTGARVVAIEKDETLVALLRQTFTAEISSGALEIIADDVRNVDAKSLGFSKYVVAANIPYYITGEIIRMFLEATPQPRALALLVQKEVAERIVARDKKESILSISVKAYGTPHIVAKVARGNFSPPPKVDSAILLIDNTSRDLFRSADAERFFAVVRAGFSSKRKFLASNLSSRYQKPSVASAFAACGVDVKVRAEDIPLETWRCLADRLSGPASGTQS